MPGRRDGITNQWYFDSVQEFWHADQGKRILNSDESGSRNSFDNQ